ncbi:MAG: ATP-dependent nuclease [Acidobacteriota bacterium]
MYISKIVSINNYRNLSNITFEFNSEINFIVGENNIGKTNLIEMFNKVVSVGKFSEEDFSNVKEPIMVVFSIEYNEDELGFFENVFDIDNEYSVTITAYQENVDARIEYCHTESEAYINPRTIRTLNFLYYSSLRSPNRELNFTNNVGTGKVLTYMVNKSLERKSLETLDLINKNDVTEVIDEVNEEFSKLNGLSGEKIGAYLNDDKENIIHRLLELGDTDGRNLSSLGDGLQYSFNIFLNILELLVHLQTTKKEEDFENLLIKKDSLKYLPLIIGLDEPEIHQHPYRQRALIKSIKNIVDNKNKEFAEIIRALFGIDGFIGQVFVVTHSPNILLNDYKQIVRFYKRGAIIDATCGSLLDFKNDTHKHLKRSFIYFKEAMFSKAIILVEGDTEFGAVPVFAERLKFNFDNEGVGLIKLDGADAVLKYLQLFEAFNIDAVAILDKDKEATYSGNPSILFTDGVDFEEEIFDMFSFRQYLKYLKSIKKHTFLIKHLKGKINGFNSKRFCIKPLSYHIPKDVGKEILSTIRDDEIQELRDCKNAINGSLLAKYVDDIPKSFKDIIYKTVAGVF